METETTETETTMAIETTTATAMETETTETETTTAIETTTATATETETTRMAITVIEITTAMEITMDVQEETDRAFQVQEEMTEQLQHLRKISYLKQNLIQEDLIQERMIQERMIERRTMRQRKILSLLTASMRRSQFQSQKRRKRRQLSSLFYQIPSL